MRRTTITTRTTPNSIVECQTDHAKSPLRKQLAKKLVTYYSQLDNLADRERSPPGSPSRRRVTAKRKMNHYRKSNILSPRKKAKYMKEKKVSFYHDPKKRKAHLEEVRDLMYTELHRARRDRAMQHEGEEVFEAMTGYPSFMRTTTDALKRKDQMRKEAWESRGTDFKQPVHKGLEKSVFHGQLNAAVDERNPECIAKTMTRTRVSVKHPQPFVRTKTTVVGPEYEEKLYPLNTRNMILKSNSAQYDQEDFHNRKAKEIRRLQFVANWQERKKRNRSTRKNLSKKRSKTPAQERQWKKTKFKELADALAREQMAKGEKIQRILELEKLLCVEFSRLEDSKNLARADPSVPHPVWIQMGPSVYPAKTLCPVGFKLSPHTQTMEVTEGDELIIHAQRPEGSFAPEGFVAQGVPESFIGTVVKPTQGEITISSIKPDFVIQEPSGDRFPIVLNAPAPATQVVQTHIEPPRVQVHQEVHAPIQPPVRALPAQFPTNSNLFTPSGRFLGKAQINLLDKGVPVQYFKALMINRQNIPEFILVKKHAPGQVVYKAGDMKKRLVHIAGEERFIFDQFESLGPAGPERNGQGEVTVLTVREKDINRPPRLIFFVEHDFFKMESRCPFVDGEEAEVVCENKQVYKGRIGLTENPDNLMIQLFPCPENGFKNNEAVRAELNPPQPNPLEISFLLDRVKQIAQERVRGPAPAPQRTPTRARRTAQQRRQQSNTQILNSIESKIHSMKLGGNTPSERVIHTESKLVDYSNLEPTSFTHTPRSMVTETVVNHRHQPPSPVPNTQRQIIHELNAAEPHRRVEIQEDHTPTRRVVTKRTTTTTPPRHKRTIINETQPGQQVTEVTTTVDSLQHTFGQSAPVVNTVVQEMIHSRSPSPAGFMEETIIRQAPQPIPRAQVVLRPQPPQTIVHHKPKQTISRRTHYTDGSFEETQISPLSSPMAVKHQFVHGPPVDPDLAAAKIQKEWRHFQWKKEYMEEDAFDAVADEVHVNDQLATLRETLGNDQDFQRFLNFYRTLPEGVDYDKAYQLFQNMMNQLFC